MMEDPDEEGHLETIEKRYWKEETTLELGVQGKIWQPPAQVVIQLTPTSSCS